MLIASAYAQTAPGADGGGLFGGGLVSLLPLILIFVVFYFLLIRPQQKKVKDHKAMVAALRRGDRVVTSGGIIGMVTKVIGDTEAQVEISEGVRVRVVRSTITEVLTRTGPAEGPAESDADDDKDSKNRDQKAITGKGR